MEEPADPVGDSHAHRRHGHQLEACSSRALAREPGADGPSNDEGSRSHDEAHRQRGYAGAEHERDDRDGPADQKGHKDREGGARG